MKILGIYRGAKFSPNHTANDEAIFRLAARNLEVLGAQISFISETEFLESSPAPRFVFTMAREKEVVSRLKMLADDGVRVTNSGTGIGNCYRAQMTQILVANRVPHPTSVIMPTRGKHLQRTLETIASDGLWIKRGDFHALHKEDVVYVPDVTQAVEMLEEFARRDIAEVVVNQHLKGDLVKFYGVRGTGFFYWFYPYDHHHVKYPEARQPAPGMVHNTFAIDDLRKEANRAAALLDVDIYGGDAIVAADGKFHLIDFNDWPSFAPCRSEAAPFIAKRIMERCLAKEGATVSNALF